jgi:Haem-degrading
VRSQVRLISITLLLMCPIQGWPQSSNSYGPPINVEAAKKVAATALAEAQKNNWKMAISIVDTGGTLVYYEKMDNTQIGSADVAIEKSGDRSPFQTAEQSFPRYGRVWRFRSPYPTTAGRCAVRRRNTVNCAQRNRRSHRSFWRHS